MNIQKSRLAAVLSLALIVCMMVCIFALPASAAEYEVSCNSKVFQGNNSTIGFLELCKADLHGYEDYTALAKAMGTMQYYPVYYDFANNIALVASAATDSMFTRYENATGYSLRDKFDTKTYYAKSGTKTVTMYAVKDPYMPASFTGSVQKFYYNDDDVVDAVSTDGLRVVLDNILNLLPIVIPVFVGFIALDKGIKFLIGVLHRA